MKVQALILALFVAVVASQSCSVTQMPNAINKDGYCSSIWFSGLNSPRGVLVLSNNDVLVVESGSGTVTVLWETGAGQVSRAALGSASGINHGIAISNGYLYASSATTVYRWPFTVGTRAALGAATTVISGMPQNDHNTRTLLFGANPNLLFVSVGSGANIDTNPDRAGVYTFDLTLPIPITYSQKSLYTHGNRNEVGIRFDAQGQLWGVENGADDLNRADLGGDIHNTNPGEEINKLGGGAFYGYPYCWTQYDLPATTLPRGTQWAWPDFISTYSDSWCRNTANNQPPAYVLTAHTAPLDIIFKSSQVFPNINTGDAFVSQHGSWDRNPPAGYAVAHVTFSNGAPVADEPFLRYSGSGATGSGWHRPVGLGWAKCQGVDCLLVSSDATGVIIAMTATSSCVCNGGQPTTPPATPKPATPMPSTPKPATPKPATAAPCSAAAAGTGTGLTGDYYDNDTGSTFFVNYVASRVDATVNFNWGSGSPNVVANFPSDNFSVRWRGQVQPLFSGVYSFYSSSDDGVRLYVNGQILIDKWIPQSQTEWKGDITLVAGQKYDIVLEYMELGGQAVQILSWSSSCQPKQVIPQAQLYPCISSQSSTGNGLTGRYYSDQNLGTLVTTQTDSLVNFDWGTGGPAALNGQSDHFSVQWTGFVVPRYSGAYTFYADSDDGARIYIDGQLVVDAWVDRAISESSGIINLDQGKKHSITYQYYENGGYAAANLQWSSQCEPKAVIPTSQLFTA